LPIWVIDLLGSRKQTYEHHVTPYVCVRNVSLINYYTLRTLNSIHYMRISHQLKILQTSYRWVQAYLFFLLLYSISLTTLPRVSPIYGWISQENLVNIHEAFKQKRSTFFLE